MRKLILHIGAHKTGSTALQLYLSRQKRRLAAQAWVFCESAGRPLNWGQMVLVRRTPEGADFPLNPAGFATLLAVVDASARNMILSAEDLFFLQDPEIATFTSALRKRFDQVTLIAYVRRQDRMTISHWQQGGRTVQSALVFGGVKGPLDNINPGMLAYLDYATRLQAWQLALPEAKLIVRVYDRALFAGGDVVADFIAATGLNLHPDGHNDDVNTAMGATTVRFIYQLRAAGLLQRPIEQALKRNLIEMTSDKIAPSRDKARAFVQMFGDSNARLARMLGQEAAFSPDYAMYPDTEVMPPLDPDYIQRHLWVLLAEAYRKPSGQGAPK